jgi:hypothetical protein
MREEKNINTLKNQHYDGSIDKGSAWPIPDQELPVTLFDGIFLLQLQIRKILDNKL